MTDPEVTQDVKTESEETPAAPSVSEEAPSRADEGGKEAQVSEAPNKTGQVPYERLHESREEIRKLKQQLDELKQSVAPKNDVDPAVQAAKEQLRKLGYLPQDEVTKLVDQKIQQVKEDEYVDRELHRLESHWDGKDGKPKFDRKEVIEYAIKHRIAEPEAAFKLLREKEIIDWHVAQAAGKSRGVKTEASDGSGSSQVGTTNDDLKTAIAQGDKGALRTFLKRLNT